MIITKKTQQMCEEYDPDTNLSRFLDKLESELGNKKHVKVFSKFPKLGKEIGEIEEPVRLTRWEGASPTEIFEIVGNELPQIEELRKAYYLDDNPSSLILLPALTVAAHYSVTNRKACSYGHAVQFADELQVPLDEIQWAVGFLTQIGVFETHPAEPQLYRCTTEFLEHGFFELQQRWVQEQKALLLLDNGFFPMLPLVTRNNG